MPGFIAAMPGSSAAGWRTHSRNTSSTMPTTSVTGLSGMNPMTLVATLRNWPRWSASARGVPPFGVATWTIERMVTPSGALAANSLATRPPREWATMSTLSSRKEPSSSASSSAFSLGEAPSVG